MTDNSTLTDTDAAVAYAARRFGVSWSSVLAVTNAIADGASVPSIDNPESVLAVIEETVPAAAFKRAQSHAANILGEWQHSATQGARSATDLLTSLSTALSGVTGGQPAAEGTPTSDLGSALAATITSLGAGHAAALVLAVGPEYAPAEAWEQVTGEITSS